MNWAREVALMIINERPNEELYTVASGVSPSGYVHIGNFREIATPYLVAKELKKLGKNVRYILSFDEYDRFRKVPGNIDASYEKYIGLPYTSIPSPFNDKESYGESMENRFLSELRSMDVEVEFIHQSKEYMSGRYNKQIKYSLDHKDEIFDIIDAFRTQDATEEEKNNFYPVSIYCHNCGKDSTKINCYDGENISYTCECGFSETEDILSSNNIKLQWKVDWPMRWREEKVTFETGGADHSAANGSKAVSERIARELFDYEPPVYIPYNFIGIKGDGAKMSSSKGNVLTLSDLLNVYDKYIIWWFYAKYQPSHAFDIALDNDVIRYYSEFDRFVKAYFDGTLDSKNSAIIESTGVTKDYLNNPNFSYLATLLPIVNNDINILKDILSKEGINTDVPEFDDRLKRAIYWTNNYGVDYQIRLLDTRNDSYYASLSDLERKWLEKTKDIIKGTYNSSDELQTALYAVVKDGQDEQSLKQDQKKYFKILYNMLLGLDKGPKLGLFLIASDKEKINSLL